MFASEDGTGVTEVSKVVGFATSDVGLGASTFGGVVVVGLGASTLGGVVVGLGASATLDVDDGFGAC